MKTPMTETAFKSNALRHVAAIGLCIKNHFRMPALILIYSGIDFMDNLSLPEQNPEVTRKDFIDWADHDMVAKHA